jgi:DNA-directed RNA polymerase subunit RPC12/RpoP
MSRQPPATPRIGNTVSGGRLGSPVPQAAPPGQQVRRRGPLWEGCEWQGTPLAGGCTYTPLNRMYARACPSCCHPVMREDAGARTVGCEEPNGAPVSRDRGRFFASGQRRRRGDPRILRSAVSAQVGPQCAPGLRLGGAGCCITPCGALSFAAPHAVCRRNSMVTTSSVCASCGRGDQSDFMHADRPQRCEFCGQRLRLRLVDLTLYRRQRTAGPVPCFTGPQEPAEVLPFTARERHQAGANYPAAIAQRPWASARGRCYVLRK